jgi:sarcosine oxidase
VVYDLIILGCGSMGAATALAAAKRGAVVLALDRASVPNTIGEHHAGARMFRTSYSEHPDYVPLLRRSFDLWKQIESASSRDLFHVTGGLYIGPENGPLIAGAAHAARLHGLAHDMLSCAELVRRFPAFSPPPDAVALFERDAGVLRPEACVQAMARQARDAGATIGTFETVLEFGHGALGEVVTDRARYRGEKLVITAGPWTSRVLASCLTPVPGAPALRITRQSLGWMKPDDPAGFAPARFPCWAWEDQPGSLVYGFPVLPGDADMRVARHRPGPEADPDTLSREPTPQDAADFEPGVRAVLPTCGPLSRAGVCLYTNSADGHFIIDRLPGADAVHLACGFSGHGFKFAPAVGEVLAGLALDGRAPLPVDFLSLSRFAGGGNA